MTLIINVSGELEVALKAQADEQGVTADLVAHRLLAHALTRAVKGEESGSSAAQTSHTEKALAFVQWAEGHRYTPPLSDEAITRSNLYPDRW